jgi:hypothetical protein
VTRKSPEADAILERIADDHSTTFEKLTVIRRAAFLGPDPTKGRGLARVGPGPIVRLLFGALARTDLYPDTPFTRTDILPPNPFVSDVGAYHACIGLVEEGYFKAYKAAPSPPANKPAVRRKAGARPLLYTAADRPAIEEVTTGLNEVQRQFLEELDVSLRDRQARALMRVAEMDYDPSNHHPAVVTHAWLGLVAARRDLAEPYDTVLGKLTQPFPQAPQLNA